jgi:hypothetical protein
MSATGQSAEAAGTAGGVGVTLRLLQAQVAEIRKKARSDERGRSIGIHVSAPWSGGATLRVEGEELPLAWCPSALAFRDELMRHERDGRQAVLLTDRSAQELGLDVLARLTKRRLYTLDAWQALHERLGVRDVDPRLRQLRWFPDHLLTVWPDDVRPASQVLDAEEVWQVLLGRLGFSDPRPDLRALLAWTTVPERLALFASLPPEARAAYVDRLAASAGAVGLAVLRLIEAGRGSEAVAAGLVCEVLFASDAAADRAVGRFEERLLGGAVLEAKAGRAWAAAALELVRHRHDAHGEAAVASWLALAGQLFAQLNIEPLAERSSWLEAGFEWRAVQFAEALNAWVDHLSDPARLEAVTTTAQRLHEHGLTSRRETEKGAVEMMVRLSRYLDASRLRRAPQRPGKGERSAEGFSEAAAWYAREGSFVDLARTAVAGASLAQRSLAAARDRLFRAVTEQRETENRRFAELLARWSTTGGESAALVPLESVLDRVVAPLAAAGPVLLLVLDGLSFPIFRELADDLRKRDWEELQPEGSVARLCGVGLLPTVTELCRTSLLCGVRRKGDAANERQGFSEHPALRKQGTATRPPVLFQKKDLASGGLGLAPAVKDEIEKTTQRVVGLVLNVVDDQLPKGGQLLPRWEVGSLRFLDEILQIARGAGRTVVITADHGHVIERETELRRHEGGGARYRPAISATGVPGEGEILVRGPRVLAGDGQVILAWSERLRYAMIASGYHGGASPQEVIVPLSVWVPFDTALLGWEPAGDDTPAWWQSESAPTMPVAQPKRTTSKPRSRSASQNQGELFATPIDWLDALFAAQAYREQLRRFGSRQGLTDETVRAVLQALDQRQGRLTLPALAHQLGLSLARGQLLVAALQRVLNVDGFGVLSFEPESESVVLDRGLLETQLLREEEE